MKHLREKNHITVTEPGYIYLTDSGREIAEMIYERHEFLSLWLERLGVPGTVRASFAVYNTREEVEAFIKALNRALDILR